MSIKLRAAAGAVAILTGAALAACAEDGSIQAQDRIASPSAPYEVPAISASAREVHSFTSVEAMADVAGLIVVGVVRDAKVGRTVAAGQEDAFELRELTVEIEVVLKGPDKLKSIVVEEEGYFQGKPYSLNGSRWANPGARAIFFLVREVGTEDERYRLANSHSRFFFDGDRVVANNPSELAAYESATERLSESELLAQVSRSL